MEISIKGGTYKEVIVVAENVRITHDVSEGLYELNSDGKKDFTKRTGSDITDGFMYEMVRFMDDLVYYRNRPFDSSDLIERLCDKMPEDKIKELIMKLNEYFVNV